MLRMFDECATPAMLDTARIKDSRYGHQHRKNNKDIQEKSYLSIQDWNLEIKETGC